MTFHFILYRSRSPRKQLIPQKVTSVPKRKRVLVEETKKNLGMKSKSSGHKRKDYDYFHKVEKDPPQPSEHSEDSEDSENSEDDSLHDQNYNLDDDLESMPSSLESLEHTEESEEDTQPKKKPRQKSTDKDKDNKSPKQTPGKSPKKTPAKSPKKTPYKSPTGKRHKNIWTVSSDTEARAAPWLEKHSVLWDSKDPEHHKNDKTDVLWEEMAKEHPPYSGKFVLKM